MGKKRYIVFCMFFGIILLCGCGIASQTPPEGEEGTAKYTLETLPTRGEAEKMSLEEQGEVFQFVYRMPWSEQEVLRYLEEQYKAMAAEQSEFAFHSFSGYQDPLLVENKVKPVNNYYMTLELSTNFGWALYEETEKLGTTWFEEHVRKVTTENIISFCRTKDILIRFIDLETKRTYEMNYTPSFKDNLAKFGTNLIGQPEDEIKAQAVACDWVAALGKPDPFADKYPAGKGPTDYAVSHFGIPQIGTDTKEELYIGILVYVRDESLEFQELADNLAQELRSNADCQAYIKNNKLSTITIVLKGDIGSEKYLTFQYDI